MSQKVEKFYDGLNGLNASVLISPTKRKRKAAKRISELAGALELQFGPQQNDMECELLEALKESIQEQLEDEDLTPLERQFLELMLESVCEQLEEKQNPPNPPGNQGQ